MPKDLTDAVDFAAITVPVDADPRNALSVELPLQQLADRTRWLIDAGTRYAGLGVVIPPLSTNWTVQNGITYRSEANTTSLQADITKLLPRGALITSFGVRLRPGAARTGTSRMNIGLLRISLDDALNITASTTMAETYDSGAAAAQWLDLATSPLAVDTGSLWHISVRSGNDGGTNKDVVAGFRVSFEP